MKIPLMHPTRFFVVPHTHWDREWYLPFEEFQLRLAVVVDELIEVLETDPDFASFTLDGQAIVLEDYLDARPEQEARAPAGTSFDPPLSLEGDVVFSCLKGAEDGDGLILRCLHPKVARGQVKVEGDFEVSRVRLDETDAAGQGAELEPSQIVSLRLRA